MLLHTIKSSCSRSEAAQRCPRKPQQSKKSAISRSAATSKPRVQTALAHRPASAHPGQEALETEAVAAVGGGTVSVVLGQHSTAQHSISPKTQSMVALRMTKLTCVDLCTSSTASDRSPPSHTPAAAPHNRPSSCYRPQSRPPPASSSPRFPSRANPRDPSSCKTP